MGIAKFDDGTPQNQKIIAAGASASWLWFCGILYCRRALTDGFIPKAVVPTLVIGLSSPFKHAARLVEVNLWHDAVGGYEVHDYLDWNPTKADVDTYRKHDRERKQSKHRGHSRNPNGIRTESERNPNDAANARWTHAGTKSESLSESEQRSGSSEESARETKPPDVPPRWRPTSEPIPQAHGLMARSASHGVHAWCCDRGLCVTLGLHAQFKGRLRGDEAEKDTRLKAFYQRTVEAIGDVEVGDSLFRFWENAFAHWIGEVTQKPAAQTVTKGARNADAWDQATAAVETRRTR